MNTLTLPYHRLVDKTISLSTRIPMGVYGQVIHSRRQRPLTLQLETETTGTSVVSPSSVGVDRDMTGENMSGATQSKFWHCPPTRLLTSITDSCIRWPHHYWQYKSTFKCRIADGVPGMVTLGTERKIVHSKGKSVSTTKLIKHVTEMDQKCIVCFDQKCVSYVLDVLKNCRTWGTRSRQRLLNDYTVSHLLRLVGRYVSIWVSKWGPLKFISSILSVSEVGKIESHSWT